MTQVQVQIVNWFSVDKFYAIACIVFILWYLFEYFKWRRKFLVPLEKLPGAKRYPFVGTLYPYINVPKKDLFDTYESNIKAMPPLFRSWNGSLPEINVRKPEHVELIMGNSIHSAKGDLYRYMLPWLGKGLLLSAGSKWHKHRKLITPTFHFKILENYLDVFEEKSNILLQQLEEKIGTGYFDIFPYITHCTLDVICETAMGVPINAMQNSKSEYVESVYGICDLVIWRALRPYIADIPFRLLPQGRKYRKYRKILHNFSYKVIGERKRHLRCNNVCLENQNNSAGKRRRLSFLDLLLEVSENGSILSDKDIREEVDTFMFEGHDTITASLSWSIFLLGNNPDIQNKVLLELQEVLGGKQVPTTIEELSRLKYLERVIKESLRLYPSVPGIVRVLGEDTFIDGYKIPKGVQAILHIYQIHRDAEYFPEPEKFDPDRFLPKNCEKRHPYSYIPFSAGIRNCIGQKFAMCESKVLLSAIVRNFEITSQETPATVGVFGDVILRPLNGIHVALKKRSHLRI